MGHQEQPASVLNCFVNTGDGNPASAYFIGEILSSAAIPTHTMGLNSSLPATIWHRGMTQSGNYNMSRTSLMANSLAHILSLEAALRTINQRAPVLIETQEFPLQFLANHPELASKLFTAMYLYVPDSEPKDKALDILLELKDILYPLVWNIPTYLKLTSLGINPILTQAVFSDVVRPQTEVQPPYAAIKHSGSGLNRTMRAGAFRSVGERLPIHELTPSQVIKYSPRGLIQSRPRASYKQPYSDIAGATEVFTYSSEVTSQLICMISQGWTGDVTFFAERGDHELRNRLAFASIGYPYRIMDLDGNISYHNIGRPKDKQKAREFLGNGQTVAQIIAKRLP